MDENEMHHPLIISAPISLSSTPYIIKLVHHYSLSRTLARSNVLIQRSNLPQSVDYL